MHAQKPVNICWSVTFPLHGAAISTEINAFWWISYVITKTGLLKSALKFDDSILIFFFNSTSYIASYNHYNEQNMLKLNECGKLFMYHTNSLWNYMKWIELCHVTILTSIVQVDFYNTVMK